MGIFSDKTLTYVSSQSWNMAGDPEARPDFMKTAVLGSVMSGAPSIADSILKANLTGAGMHTRRFFRWAQTNYGMAMPSGSLGVAQEVSAAAALSGLQSQLTLAAGEHLKLLSSLIDDADVTYWAEAWIARNRPELEPEGWSAEYDPATEEILILIGAEPVVRIPAEPDFLWGRARQGRKLLFIAYRTLTEQPDGTAIEGPIEFFTYRMGSGVVAFDALQAAADAVPEFFPALPLRLDNASIRDDGHEDTYAAVKKAFRKLAGSSVDEVLDTIEDNESIDDIDFCFLVLGVALNEPDKVAMDYVYRFFREMMNSQKVGPEVFGAYYEHALQWGNVNTGQNRWTKAHTEGITTHPAYGTVYPSGEGGTAGPPPKNELTITASDLNEYDIRLRWHYIAETQHRGNAKTYDGNQTRGTLEPGQFWFHRAPPLKLISQSQSGRDEFVYLTQDYPRLYLFHQYHRFRYRRLEILSLEHLNYVYGDHAVTTQAADALELSDDESPFLVPLHYPTLRDMGMVNANRLAGSCSHLVFNSYTERTQKWWQRGVFKYILVVAAVGLSLFTGGASLAAGAGILGTNVAVGTFLGASVASAALVGAIANGIAAIIVSSLISKASVKLFGEKWGAIIGTIASFVAMTYATQYMSTGSFDVDWGRIMRVDNIMELTNSVSDAYSRWIAADTNQIMEQMTELGERYADKLEEIEDLSKEILGMTSSSIDPMMFTDATEYFGETRETFLTRTLLTGSDIAELTHSLIENFAEISLELPKALR